MIIDGNLLNFQAEAFFVMHLRQFINLFNNISDADTCITYQGILVSQAIFFVVFAHFMSIKAVNVVYGCARHPDLRNGRIIQSK